MEKLYKILKYTFITLWTVFIVAPFLWAVSTSFKDFQSVNSKVTYIPWLDFEPTLEGWRVLIKSPARGGVDIVVTDGFSGNIALKTAEGIAGLFATLLRRCFKASLPAKLGYLLARGALKDFRAKVDPRRYNGAVFLGLNGIAVKSHGGTDAIGFANAIDVATSLVGHGFIPDVSSAIAKADGIRAKRKNVNG